MRKTEKTGSELAMNAMRRAVRRALAEKGPNFLVELENGAVIAIEVKRVSGFVSDGLAEEIVAEALTRAGFSVRFPEPVQVRRPSETNEPQA